MYAVQIGVVGRYAISVQWSDGHDSGIYSYRRCAIFVRATRARRAGRGGMTITIDDCASD